MNKNIPKLPFGTVGMTIWVDYDESFEGMAAATVEAGTHPAFFSEGEMQLVPVSGKGLVRKLAYLVPFFKRDFRNSEVLDLLSRLSLRPGKAEELLSVLRYRLPELKKREIKKVVAIGTQWEKALSSGNRRFNLFYNNDRFSSGYADTPWPDGGWWILGIAEDEEPRKIHKTPRLNLSYPQPKSYQPPKETNGLKPVSISGLSGVLGCTITVDYNQTFEQMARAAGFDKGIEYSLAEAGKLVSVQKGKPAKGNTSKHRVYLVPLKNIQNDGNVTITQALELFKAHNLKPAHAEDLLAVCRDYRSVFGANNIWRFAQFGINEAGNNPVCVWGEGGGHLVRVFQPYSLTKKEWDCNFYVAVLPK